MQNSKYSLELGEKTNPKKNAQLVGYFPVANSKIAPIQNMWLFIQKKLEGANWKK